jgi:hypothetical protein
MGQPLSTFLILLLPPLAAAFAAQLFVSSEARHRVRRWAAGLWIALLAAISSWTDENGSRLGIFLATLLLLALFFLVAYGGALAGSWAALRLKRLAHRVPARR